MYFAHADKFQQTLTVIEKELASSKEEYIENFRKNFMLNPAEPHKTAIVWIDTSRIDKKKIVLPSVHYQIFSLHSFSKQQF